MVQELSLRKRGGGPAILQVSHIVLARLQRDQPTVAGVGDGDNSLSMRRVKLGSYGCMIQAAGAGGGWHPTAFGSVGCVEED